MFFKRIFYSVMFVSLLSYGDILAQSSHTSNSYNTMHKNLIQPNYLKAGDTVAIVAPSGILNNREIFV